MRVNGNFAFDLQFCVRGMCVQGGIFCLGSNCVQGAMWFKGRFGLRGDFILSGNLVKGQFCSRGNLV